MNPPCLSGEIGIIGAYGDARVVNASLVVKRDKVPPIVGQ